MGLRATVIKKYEIEYGNANGFNYDPETLIKIIGEYCDEFYCGDDDWGGYSTNAYWEIDKEQFKKMVADIEAMPEDEFNQRMREDWFRGYDDEYYSKDYILEVFKGWLNETPEDYMYVRLGWL